MNILLLTADSLRADRTSLFGHEQDTTPFLADIASDAFEFRRAYVNGRNTAASFPAIHTSTHERYYDGIGIPPSGTPTLAEVLSEAGYGTHAVHTNELISRDYNYDRGFDVYRDSRGDPDEDGESSGLRAVVRDLIGDGRLFELVKRMHFASTEYLGIKLFDTADALSGFEDEIVEWATTADEDWFVWGHYMNPHHPYEPPEDCQRELGLDPVPKRTATKLSRKMRLHPDEVTADERETLRGLYDASVLSWDREIASTYRALAEAGALDDTLIVVTSDHGELLGEGGYYGHPPVLRQELLRVPLLFLGSVKSGESDSQVGLLDLAPTIVTLVGADVPSVYQGQTLFDRNGRHADLESRPVLSSTGEDESDVVCAVDGNRKVVYDVNADEWSAWELSENGLDGTQTDETYPDLQEVVQSHIEDATENRRDAAEIDREDLEEDLAALGYLEK